MKKVKLTIKGLIATERWAFVWAHWGNDINKMHKYFSEEKKNQNNKQTFFSLIKQNTWEYLV